MDEGPDSVRIVRFHGVGDIREVLPAIGNTPLPPYIKRDPSLDDQERYQTVYATHEGAVAAPTAGLHFTGELLDRLASKGIEFAKVTLHVGPGTFQPVRVDTITEHRMLPERYSISDASAGHINRAKAEHRRVIAVGTTSVRTIETAAHDDGAVIPGEGSSTLFIHPGYRFKTTDGLITNFHLPKSTLLMLVSAFAGRERVLSAYREAVAEQYRFYSYGDAMILL
jgi:S-adenosylmethionine:tRNA ribosyltransferase-isomerase